MLALPLITLVLGTGRLCDQHNAPSLVCCSVPYTLQSTCQRHLHHPTIRDQVDGPRTLTGSTAVGRCSFASHDAGRRVGPELLAEDKSVCACVVGGV